jgi:hypothetical protein
MRRHTLLALSLAAGLALPVAFPTAAFAISDEERANLASAAMISPATMQAATTTALRNLAADRPLTLALDELAGVLLDLGMTDDFKAEFALNLVAAARELAATGAVDGFSAETAGDAAAEAVLVRAQGSSTLVSAIFANASTMAASDPSGLTGTMVLGSFVTASTSPLIRIENQTAVREAAVATMTQTASLETGATRPARPFGAGPNLRGITLVNTYLGGPGRAGNRVLEVVSGSAISPN